jgi:hypothetical protein
MANITWLWRRSSRSRQNNPARHQGSVAVCNSVMQARSASHRSGFVPSSNRWGNVYPQLIDGRSDPDPGVDVLPVAILRADRVDQGHLDVRTCSAKPSSRDISHPTETVGSTGMASRHPRRWCCRRAAACSIRSSASRTGECSATPASVSLTARVRRRTSRRSRSSSSSRIRGDSADRRSSYSGGG